MDVVDDEDDGDDEIDGNETTGTALFSSNVSRFSLLLSNSSLHWLDVSALLSLWVIRKRVQSIKPRKRRKLMQHNMPTTIKPYFISAFGPNDWLSSPCSPCNADGWPATENIKQEIFNLKI